MRARHGASTTHALALGLVTLAAPAISQANALGMYGYGARASAMAGALTADADDGSANYYNPGALVRAERTRVDLAYHWAQHALTANGRDNRVDPAHGLAAMITAPGRAFDIPFAFGLGVYLPDDRISRSRSLPQGQPRWELYDNRVQILSIMANVAFAPTRWLRFGGGISFVSSTRGTLDIYGDIAFPDAANSNLAHTVDADLRAVRYPQAGIEVDLGRYVSLGATYRGAYELALELDARVAGNVVIGGVDNPAAMRFPGSYLLSSRSVAVTLPQQAALGVRVRPLSSLTIVADLTWVDWPAYQNPTAQLGTALDLQLPPNLANIVPATPPPVQRLPASFLHTFTPRLGLEWRRAIRVHELSLRGGYRFDPSPVPEQTGATNFYDAHRHVVSAGAGFYLRGLQPTLRGGLRFDVYADLQAVQPRAVRKSDPLDPVGDALLGGYVFGLGATVGVQF